MTQPPRNPTPRRPPLRDRRRRERRVLLVGLVLSFVVHLVAIGVFGSWLEVEPTPPMPERPRVYVPPSGMRAVRLAPTTEPESEPAAAPVAPEPAPEPSRPERTAPSPEVAAEAPADSLTAAQRLAPRVVDPRLYEPLVVLPWEPTFADVEARIWAAVEMLSDSALAEAEAALRSLDWTVTDADGGRWGISPGRLHLGKITLPLPIAFPVSAEAAAEQRQWYELEQQLERTRILESFEERVRAIRERRERERAEAKAGNGG